MKHQRYFYFVIAIIAILLSSHSFAQSDRLQKKLGSQENPVLAPAQIKNLPYTRLFLSMNAVPMLVWDSEGGLVAANDQYLKLIGYTRKELQQGKIDWATITPPEYLALDHHCINQLKDNEFCTPFVKEYVRKDGKRIAVKLWNARNKEKNGQAIAIIIPLELSKVSD